MGDYLLKKLGELKNKFAFIREARGAGLMTALDLNIESFPIFLKALKEGLVINSTHNTVLRIMPALNVSKQELDQGLGILEDVLNDF